MISALVDLVTLTFDLLTLKLVRVVPHPTGNNANQVQGQKVKGQGHQAQVD